MHGMKMLPLIAATFSFLCTAAEAQEPIRLGIAAPLSGANEILGRQASAGAASLPDAGIARTEIDTPCTPEAGADAARRFAEEKVAAVVGFVCTPPLLGALPILAAAGIPALDIGARSDRVLRDGRDRSLVWRVASGPDAEAQAVADLALSRWGDESFALVEDGSPVARDLADNVRERLEAKGRAPSLADNYRPAEERQFGLARRLLASGLTRALVFGTREDIAILARDAAAAGLELQIISGESVFDAAGVVPLPTDLLAVSALPDADAPVTEEPPALEGHALSARTGTEIAAQAIRRARAENRPVADVLDRETFVTSSGLVRFDAARGIVPPPFRIYRWNGERFVAENG